ncbi:MAG: hypothetical protein COU90_02535 [Candidatus Ryanbacteria bacterium CG10_big_fil_rev_8_21_14_0_10_43_42]|uniref:Nudix hydrolase domain-containing protein n=1 Tax=Candidatus Ryanbacteria bacterium CG10_big_fil_rev_8_21_14_0_10_43_42 TaxID=1974864 RepID=A0A2M8KWJ3_9BACT|nr:MAG: hypothetical protein COU90_02535 [Candidatus Ryanbacteria bacterium CG10_big_fil_rev_8_21_14_0_10_43_42]
MKSYTLGFVFNTDLSKVLLMEKQHPDWQRGKYNGIGGKIEEGEESRACIVREIEEESGLSTEEADWIYIGVLKAEEYVVDVYALVYMGARTDAVTTTDERVEWFSTVSLPDKVIPNLRWMVPFALDKITNKEVRHFMAEYP